MNSHFITELRIKKIRHLENIIIPLSETECKHLILTGKNGSGKTSVIEALASYLNQYVTEQGNNVTCWEQRNADINKMLIDTNLVTAERTRLKQEFVNNQQVLQEYLQGAIPSVKKLDDMVDKIFEGKFIVAYYKATREYKVANATNIEKVQFEKKYAMQDLPGRQLVKYLLDLKTTEALAKTNGKPERAQEIAAWFQEFEKFLQEIFADAQLRLEFDIDTYEFSIVEPGKEPFAFDTLSSGYAAILEIIIDLLMRMEHKTAKGYNLEGIVLIDEIETHLHLELQKEILKILTKFFPNIQFIVTTHSPFILNSVPNAVIYDLANRVLVNTKEGLSNVPYDGIVEGYFGASMLSQQLQQCYDRYRKLANKAELVDEDYAEIAKLELYLDEIPDYLALAIMADYQRIKTELAARE